MKAYAFNDFSAQELSSLAKNAMKEENYLVAGMLQEELVYRLLHYTDLEVNISDDIMDLVEEEGLDVVSPTDIYDEDSLALCGAMFLLDLIHQEEERREYEEEKVYYQA